MNWTPTTVAFNGQVTVQFTGGALANLPDWHFEAVNGLYVQGPSFIGTWQGNVVMSGKVVVWYTYNGVEDFAETSITVQPRTWSWASVVGGQEAVPGEIDSCFLADPNELGLTASRHCLHADEAP